MRQASPSIERIVVRDVVGSPDCVSSEDADRLHDRIVAAIESGSQVELSFAGVERLPTCFLNPAIGRLYGIYGPDGVRRHLAPPVDAQPWQLANLRMVAERARVFFDENGEAQPQRSPG